MTWEWLSEKVVLAIHGEQLAEHGGASSGCDEGLLASALARPRNQAAYGAPSVFDLAAAYAFGIIRDHPFVDGNKRTGFLAAYTFLYLNGWELTSPEADAVTAVLSLASGDMNEAGFSDWLERNAERQ